MLNKFYNFLVTDASITFALNTYVKFHVKKKCCLIAFEEKNLGFTVSLKYDQS